MTALYWAKSKSAGPNNAVHFGQSEALLKLGPDINTIHSLDLSTLNNLERSLTNQILPHPKSVRSHQNLAVDPALNAGAPR